MQSLRGYHSVKRVTVVRAKATSGEAMEWTDREVLGTEPAGNFEVAI